LQRKQKYAEKTKEIERNCLLLSFI